MEESIMKRFKLFVGNNYGVQTIDGEVIFDSIRSIADADVLVDWLNDLSEENEQLKKQLESEHTMLDNAILLERTRMGQNSLKQYKEAIQ